MVEPTFTFRRKAHSIHPRLSTGQQFSFAQIKPLRSTSGSIRRRQEFTVRTTSFKSALRRKTQSGTHRPTRARRRVCWCCSRRQKPNRWPRFRRNLDCVRLLEAQDYLRSSLLEVVCFALIAKNVLNSFFTDDQALTLHSGRKEKTDSNSRRRGTASALGIMSSCPRLLPE